MSLTFEPESIAYDRDEGVMRFFASDGGVLVRCGVSIAALAQLEDDARAPQAMVITYHRNRALIQEIVERKYQGRQFERGGSVIFGSRMSPRSFHDTRRTRESPAGTRGKRGLGNAVAAHPRFGHSKPSIAREGQRTNYGPLPGLKAV
jgi:hypothetical protein